MRHIKKDTWTDENGAKRVRELFLLNRSVVRDDEGHLCSYVVVDYNENVRGKYGPETMAFWGNYKGDILSFSEICMNNIENPETAIQNTVEDMQERFEEGTYDVL